MTSSRLIELLSVALTASACATRSPSAAPRATPPTVAAPAPSADATPPTPPPSEPANEYSCTVKVDVLGTPYEGRGEGSGTSTVSFQAKAELEACAKMREGSGIDCKETERFLRGHTSSFTVKNQVGSGWYVVRLTPVLAEKTATASSDLGGREACLAAVDSACKGAPTGSVCTPKHVGCEMDESGKNWNCQPLRRRVGAALVPSEPFVFER
jgi:hypothetical protein